MKKTLLLFFIILSYSGTLNIAYATNGVGKVPDNEPILNLGLQLGYKVHGFDVSHYQEQIDWDKLKGLELDKDVHLSFVFMRATMGADRRDVKFNAYWQEAKRIGLMRAPYHYFDVKQSTQQQVNNFVSCVKLEVGDLPPVLDLEVRRFRKKAQVLHYQQAVKSWLVGVEKKLGVKPIVYCSYTFYHTYLAETIKDYPLWIAYYHKPLNELKTNSAWNFWQHSNTGNIDGVRGYVDMNVFNGSVADLERLCVTAINPVTTKRVTTKAMVMASVTTHKVGKRHHHRR